MAPPRRKRNHRRQQKQEQEEQQANPEEKGDGSDKSCSLLKLPAELRNAIYELALSDENGAQLVHWPEHIKNLDARRTAVPGPEAKRAKEIVLSTHPLTQVNKKIRSEVLPMAIMMAPVLKFTVHDFDFTRLMSLFDHYRIDDPNYRNPEVWLQVDIELVFSDSYNVSSRSEHPDLHEWLLRASDEGRNAYSPVPRYSVHQPIKFAMPKNIEELGNDDTDVCVFHFFAVCGGVAVGPKAELKLKLEEEVAESLSWPCLEDAASWGWKRPSRAEIKAEALRRYKERE
ncbi:hypothetical protein PRZ48_000207 [Zasmidium cellare]|uniref:Uncharacterized protein n=1 Tax=Zasmidium cellare TaxID=395010 RepID=A0ABR0EZI3_ZASCE|nr:hypothetical protein PRZ48_000207 [Zasmidium cellare]